MYIVIAKWILDLIHDCFLLPQTDSAFNMVPTGMPERALPQSFRKGRLSYTIIAPSSGAKIEVLLKQKAFRITKVGEENGKLEILKKGLPLFVSIGVLEYLTNEHNLCLMMIPTQPFHIQGTALKDKPVFAQKPWHDDIEAAWACAMEDAAWS